MKKITKKGIDALEKRIYTIESPCLKKYFVNYNPQYYNLGKTGLIMLYMKLLICGNLSF